MSGILLQELLEYLDSYLNIDQFKDYCPNGLQLRGNQTVNKIAFSTSVSLEIIDQAIARGVDAIVVHHGLFWDKDPRVIDGPILKKLKKLLDHNISLIAYHLPLDAHKDVGNNFPLLKMLGCKNLEPFESIGASGHIHTSQKELVESLKKLMNFNPIIPRIEDKQVRTIATVSGGGHSFIKQASSHKIDAFITGTSDEWVWDFAIENEILFIPLGHYRSELLGVKLLKEHVSKVLGLETIFLESGNLY